MSKLVRVFVFVVLFISNAFGYRYADENGAPRDKDETILQKMENLEEKLAEYENILALLRADQEKKLQAYEDKLTELRADQEKKLQAYENKLTNIQMNQVACEQKLNKYGQENSVNRQLLYNFSQEALSYHAVRSKRASAETPAFYAYMSADRCIGSHEAFLFDVAVTNVGGGYNSHDGIFDVPVSGIYVFTFTVFGNNHRYVRAELIVDGQVKSVILADADEINDYHTATSTVVLHVKAGDHVFVRRSDSYSECYVLSNFGRALTTFSGWMIFAD